MGSNSLDEDLVKYMRDIYDIPLIDEEEEKRLSKILLESNSEEEKIEARNKLIQSNLRFVVTLAGDFKRKYGLPYMDLISEGNVGLMQAAEKFDYTRGAKFSTHASWWINQSMRRIVENKVIRIPTSSLRKIRKIKRAEERLEGELGRYPTDQEISDVLEGITDKTAGRLRHIELNHLSLQDIINGDDAELSLLIPDEKAKTPYHNLMTKDLNENIERYLKCLDEREYDVIIRRFGLNGYRIETLEEISEKYDLTRERIRQIQNRALKKIRKAIIKEMEDEENKFNGKNSEKLNSSSIFRYKKNFKEYLHNEFKGNIYNLFHSIPELHDKTRTELRLKYTAFYNEIKNDPIFDELIPKFKKN